MRRSILIFGLLSLALLTEAQTVRENYFDGEFFMAQEEYEEAFFAFNQVYKYGYQDNASLNYRMGICLLYIEGRKSESISYLEKAAAAVSDKYKGAFKEEVAPPDALLYLGNAYRIDMQLEKAIEKYNAYLGYLTSNRDKLQRAYTQSQIQSCQNAVAALNQPVEYTMSSLGQVKETHSERYNTVFSHDRRSLAFMGVNPFYNSVEYAYIQEDGTWSVPRDLSPEIVSDGNMDVVGLSADGKTMLLAVYDEFDSDIYTSVLENSVWSAAVPLDKPVNSRFYESHATFSPDGNKLFFSSNRSSSDGGMDIFVSGKQADGTWGEPVNLGPGVNTDLNDEAPFLSPDGKRLYFSSQGHETIGGFDVFYSDLQADGTWGKAQNLGYPLNSTDDDFSFTPLALETERNGMVYAKGVDAYDLYRIEFIDLDATAQQVDLTYPPVATSRTETEVAEAPQPVVPEQPVVQEPVAEQPVAEEVAVAEPAEEAVVAEPKEEMAVAEPAEEVAEQPAKPLEPEATPEPEVEPEPEVAPEPVATPEPTTPAVPERYLVKPVFFAFDSDELSRTAKNKLDELAGLMTQFPALKLEVIGHTDALGSEEYNDALSIRRANAVRDYLIAGGVSDSRLVVRGMSERSPVARNRTRNDQDAPEGRKLNRRVQFKVSVQVDVLIEMEKIQVPDDLRLDD
ncbi:MAG: OmpA family protein [Bacteroidales bacterium]